MQSMCTPSPIEKSAIKLALVPRPHHANKGTFGSVGIIGGSDGMVGALVLAARAAQLSGAGKVYAASLAGAAPAVDMLHPEIMFRPCHTLAEIQPALSAIAIGPGLGQSPQAVQQLEYWLNQATPLLIDADALNLISQHSHLQHLLAQGQDPRIITPHPGEAARLLKCSVLEIQQQRVESAIQIAQKLNVICVLKGAGSLCAQADGTCFINTTGNVGLASAGTGDVLSGIIVSLVAQGLSSFEAAKAGVYIHGAAADSLVAQGIGPAGLTASEVALEARKIINQLAV